MWRVAFGGMAYVARVEDGEERCLPACTRRRSVEGMEGVRRERRERRVEIEVLGGRERGIAVSFC